MISDGGGWKWIEEDGQGSTANSCNIILPPVVRYNTMPDRKDHEIKNGIVEVVWRIEVKWEQ